MKWFAKPLFIFFAVILAMGCNSSEKPADSTFSKDNIAKDSIANKQSTDTIANEEILTTIATEVLIALKAKDYKAFSAYFHPTDSVLFSPYGYIDVKTCKKFTKAAFVKLVESPSFVNWGSYDGSGEPIRLTTRQYLEKFVYNADYLNAEKKAFNQVIGKGNSLNNLAEIYPHHPFMEYHFTGFDKKYGGMDWTSLRLVFKQYQSNYYLVAIIHDQWTS